VRTSAATGDGFERLTGGRRGGVSDGDGLLSGLELDGAVLAGCLGEFADGPAGLRLDPAADGKGGEDDAEVGLRIYGTGPLYGPRLVRNFSSANRKRAGQDDTSLTNSRS
jgi:hypothetical protein